MDHSAARKARFSQTERFIFSLLFFLSFIFLLVGCIPSLTSFPGILARFTGVETTARASAKESCGDGGDYFTFTFTDQHEKVYHLANTSTCFSGIFTDDERVTLWYQPDDPSHFITENELSFELPFLVGFSLPFFIVSGTFVFYVFRRLRGQHTSQEITGAPE